MSEARSIQSLRTTCPRMSRPRMSRARASASSGRSASLIPPAFPRPPVSTCALTTTGPPSSSAAARACSGLAVLRSRGAVRRSIGYVPQESGVDRYATGRENLTLQGRIQGLRGTQLRRRVDELLELIGIADAADRVVRGYSGGMKRRLDV